MKKSHLRTAYIYKSEGVKKCNYSCIPNNVACGQSGDDLLTLMSPHNVTCKKCKKIIKEILPYLKDAGR